MGTGEGYGPKLQKGEWINKKSQNTVEKNRRVKRKPKELNT